MPVRTPRRLKQKRAELAYERVQLTKRLAQIDTEVGAIDYALRVLDPAWKPPRNVARPSSPTLLPRGAVAQACLQHLRQHGAQWTPDIARRIAAEHKLALKDKRAEEHFGSSVAMALRRYERQGLVEAVETNPHTQALRWRLRAGADGRLAPVRKAA